MRTVILKPLAKIYGLVSGLRNYMYDSGKLKSYSVDLPVICVGNISAGGNGKTPLCISIVSELKKRGFAPVVLTRGYGGKSKGEVVITQNTSCAEVGDEACLVFRAAQVPVVVSKDRLAGARLIVQQKLGNIIVLDDGFQHRRLERDINIVSVNAGSEQSIKEFLAMELLPLGKFREDGKKALQRSDFLIFSRRMPNTPISISARDALSKLLALRPELRVYDSYVEPLGVFGLQDGKPLAAQKIIAFSGIANPEGFHQTLTAVGFTISKAIELPDHYPFSQRDIDHLTRSFPDIPLVCTEKDAVKLRELADIGQPLYYLKINTVIDRQEQFFDELISLLNVQKVGRPSAQAFNL